MIRLHKELLLKEIPENQKLLPSSCCRCIRSPNSPRPIFPPISQNIPQYHLLCLLRGSHSFPLLFFQRETQRETHHNHSQLSTFFLAQSNQGEGMILQRCCNSSKTQKARQLVANEATIFLAKEIFVIEKAANDAEE